MRRSAPRQPGDVLLTPLQIASGYATIGNGGTVWQPHVVKEVRDGVTRELKVDTAVVCTTCGGEGSR